MMDLMTRAVRTYLAGRSGDFTFRASGAPVIDSVQRASLYVHVPFCRSKCPYCPYNTAPYAKEMLNPYARALLKEIDMYHDRYGTVQVPSIYIGGGTPTLMMDELGVVLERLAKHFRVEGEICIETNVHDVDAELISNLRRHNVRLISLGVQSFQEKWLRLMGRKHDPSSMDRVRQIVNSGSFKTVNIDLIFALPDQTIEALRYDLESAIACGVDQITAYPLFTFPYTTIGRYRKLAQVGMPKLSVRRTLYNYIYDSLISSGFRRVSVWGFARADVPRYSSVTRDNYIGFGPGAGSHMSDGYYLNTFSVGEYMKRCERSEFPTALHMHFSDAMQDLFWLYWRLYDTYVPKQNLDTMSSSVRKKALRLLNLCMRLGLCSEHDGRFELTQSGTFWVHLAQNYYSLRYIDKIWTAAMKEPYPEKVRL